MKQAELDAEPIVQTEFELEDGLHELAFPAPQSDAGLIEAAEIADQCANGSFSKNEAMYLRGFAERLRARAASQSNAEPVAWLVHSDRGMNFATVDKLSAYLYAERHPNYSVEPLYSRFGKRAGK